MLRPQSAAYVLALGLAAGAAHAQNYPAKPVRIVTTVPGGSQDLTARLIAPKLSERLGQQCIVDNRGGILSMELVAKAPADGYTLLLASGSLWTSQFLRDDVSWDVLKDYAPISLLVSSPNILVVHPSLPVKSVKELVALAKRRQGELNYASGQSGSSSHIAGELFKSMAGVDIVRIAYKGQGPAMLSLMTGETQLSFPNAASATAYMKTGKIRPLAVTTLQPSALAPGLPTLAASGLPGYESKAILGMFAPAKTPAAIVEQLNREIAAALNSPDVKQRLFDSGAEPIGGTPAQMAAEMRNEIATSGKLLKSAGIRR